MMSRACTYCYNIIFVIILHNDIKLNVVQVDFGGENGRLSIKTKPLKNPMFDIKEFEILYA